MRRLRQGRLRPGIVLPPLRSPLGEPTQAAEPLTVHVVDGDFAASKEAGRGCALLLTSTPVAFVVFFVAWILGSVYLAVRTGVYREGEPAPLWLGFAIFIAPIIVAVVGRKVIRRVIPIIMGSGLLIVLAIVMFFVLMIGVSMVHGLFFDWPGAH